MSGFNTTDFATLLDEVIAAAEDEEQEREGVSRPAVSFDILGLGVAGATINPAAAADYLFAATEGVEGIRAVTPPPLAPDLPSVDPAAIGRELALTGRETLEKLDRLRREFAFANHPDRVPVDVQDRAIIRMQIANQLIDEAKRRLMSR